MSVKERKNKKKPEERQMCKGNKISENNEAKRWGDMHVKGIKKKKTRMRKRIKRIACGQGSRSKRIGTDQNTHITEGLTKAQEVRKS